MSKTVGKTDSHLSSRGPVRLLVLEDVAADAELMLAILKRAGFQLAYDVIDSPELFQQRIQQGDYDLVISDHNLTTWTGMDALEILRESGKDIPFVVTTGTLGDEAAVDYIKRGAADYVLKNRLERLPVAVGHALREKAHRDEEARFHELILNAKRNWELTFDSVPDPVLLLDSERRVQRANRAATEVFGIEFSQLIGMPCYEVLSCHGETSADCPHKQLMQTGQNERQEIKEQRLGKYFDMTCSPLRGPVGVIQGCVVVLRDISARKQAEAQIHLQAAALESAANAILITCRQGVITWGNPAFTRLTGYSIEEVLGQNPRMLKSGVQPPGLYEEMWKAILAGQVWQGEVTNRRKDGTLYNVEMTITPVRDALGEVSHFVAIQQDVSARKRTENALHASEVRYRRLFESAKDGILILDSDSGQIVDVNPFLEQMLGYSREEILDKKLWQIGAFENIPANQLAFQELQSKGYCRYEDLPLKTKDGQRFDVEFVSNVYLVEDRKVIQCNVRDISVRKRAEAEIHKLNEDLENRVRDRTVELELANRELDSRRLEAERASKFKDQFLSTMSHELRTPLNAVLGFSELLADEMYGQLNESQRRYLGHIRNGGQHLVRLVNEVLDLSRIEAGRMELVPEDVAIEPIFAEALETVRALVDQKSLQMSQEIEPGLMVRADAMHFRQILLNLLGNAIKFTPAGGCIMLKARKEDDSIRMDVCDTGPGIPPEEHDKIFEAFYRMNHGDAAVEGTGLGLAITQRLVEMQGGHLGVESKVGKGSCFFFYFPAVLAAETHSVQKRKQAEPVEEYPLVLAVEDDPVSLHLIQTQLAWAGYRVAVCENSQLAFQQAVDLQPAAITLDILMKPVSGWDVLSQLRADPRTLNIPVIVTSVVDQRGTGISLGAEEYLLKPIQRKPLLAAIERCFDRRGVGVPVRPILVVEDDADTRELITEILSSQGFAVAAASDGVQARALVASTLPELVLLDLVLPKVSGFDLLAEWRADPRTSGMPVFVLSGKELTRQETAFLRHHSELLMRKQEPWQLTLVNQLRRVLNAEQETDA